MNSRYLYCEKLINKYDLRFLLQLSFHIQGHTVESCKLKHVQHQDGS